MMNKLLSFLSLTLLTTCSPSIISPSPPAPMGYTCSINNTTGIATVTCLDGTNIPLVPGPQGSPGPQGAVGAAGAQGSVGATGSQGTAGTNGAPGLAGSNGVSSAFIITPATILECASGGYDIALTDTTHSQTISICNGNAGATGNAGTNGTNGQNGGTVSFSLVQVIQPCGAASSPWKEVLLGLQGGQILSSFSEAASGTNTRFSFIPNGTYSDTDASGCSFTVSGDGSTTNSITWGSGSNSYSTWTAGGFNWTTAAGWVSI